MIEIGPIDLLKVITLIVAIISVLIAYITYITISIPSKIDQQIATALKDLNNKYESILQSKSQLLELITDCIINIKQSKSDERIYLIKHFLRLSSHDQDERQKSFLALLGFGKEIAFLIPYIEQLKNTSKWTDEDKKEYKKILDRLAQL